MYYALRLCLMYLDYVLWYNKYSKSKQSPLADSSQGFPLSIWGLDYLRGKKYGRICLSIWLYGLETWYLKPNWSITAVLEVCKPPSSVAHKRCHTCAASLKWILPWQQRSLLSNIGKCPLFHLLHYSSFTSQNPFIICVLTERSLLSHLVLVPSLDCNYTPISCYRSVSDSTLTRWNSHWDWLELKEAHTENQIHSHLHSISFFFSKLGPLAISS